MLKGFLIMTADCYLRTQAIETFWQTFGRLRLYFTRFLCRYSDFSSRVGLCLQLQERIRAVRSVLKHLARLVRSSYWQGRERCACLLCQGSNETVARLRSHRATTYCYAYRGASLFSVPRNNDYLSSFFTGFFTDCRPFCASFCLLVSRLTRRNLCSAFSSLVLYLWRRTRNVLAQRGEQPCMVSRPAQKIRWQIGHSRMRRASTSSSSTT